MPTLTQTKLTYRQQKQQQQFNTQAHLGRGLNKY